MPLGGMSDNYHLGMLFFGLKRWIAFAKALKNLMGKLILQQPGKSHINLVICLLRIIT